MQMPNPSLVANDYTQRRCLYGLSHQSARWPKTESDFQMQVIGSELAPHVPATETPLIQPQQHPVCAAAVSHNEFELGGRSGESAPRGPDLDGAGALVQLTKPMSAATATGEAGMAAAGKVSGEQPGEPLAHLVVVSDGGSERSVPISDQLFVGRECAGISPPRRLVIDDPEISRTHLEIRLDAAGDQAFVIDTSSNGTLLNGVRLERAALLPIRPGDEIRIGDVALTFRSQRFTTVNSIAPRRTRARIGRADLVMVVGDIVNYSTIAQVTDEAAMARSLHTLWHQLAGVLRAHRGTLSYYAGDALFAIWELGRFPDAAELGIDFALAANRLIEDLGPELPLRDPDGSPIHMGWGVAKGIAARAAMTRSADAVIGDATNVAFRLAGLAGRHGRAAVMATNDVRRTVGSQFRWGAGELVEIKGRRGMETVFPVIGRKSCRTGRPSRAGDFAKRGIGDLEANFGPRP
jgi:adenylate cyclase